MAGYAIGTSAQLPLPSFTIIQVNATHWQGNGTAELGYILSYSPPPSVANSYPELDYTLSYSPPASRVGTAMLGYGLRLFVSYGGTFHVNRTWVVNPIKDTHAVGSGRIFALNVTIWSPYGTVDRIKINISDVASYLYDGALQEAYDPYGLFEAVGYQLTASGGWVHFALELRPSWGAGGTYDVFVYAEELEHGCSGDTTYPSLFSVINATALHSYSLNRTVYFPGDPVKLTLKVVYNETSVGVEGENLWVNGTQLTTGPDGVAIHEFIAPSTSGTYTLNITLAHGRTYFVNFSVSGVILRVYTRTEANETLRLPSSLLVQVYDYATGELVGEYTGKEAFDIPLDTTGTYLLRMWYHGMLIAEVVHDQVELEQALIINPIKQLVDHLGRSRGLLSNVSTSYSFDNLTRRLLAELGGSGVGRLVYIVNYTKPLLVVSNTSITVRQLEGELVIDAALPANITILDPRKMMVLVKNPYGLPFTPAITFYNLTAWSDLMNASIHEVPAQHETTIKASYKGVDAVKRVPLLEDINITIILPYDAFLDYRNASREIVANASFTYESMSTKFPYSRMRVLVSGDGGFRLRIAISSPPTRLDVASNTTIAYSFEDGWLTVEGRLNSTSELRITDLYRVRVEAYDRLNRSMPSWFYLYINETMYSGSAVEDYLRPEDYVIRLPETVNGFRFYGFLDGYNATIRPVTVSAPDIALKVWYRVAVIASVEGIRVGTTWWPSLIPISQDDERISVYFEIRLRDYYGEAVPNRPVLVKVIPEGMETGWLFNLTTDPSGYTQTPLVRLSKYRNYLVEVEFAGDDIYADAKESLHIAGAELPELPTEAPTSPSYLLMLIPIGLAVALAITIIKLRHILPAGRRRRALREIDWSW